MGLLNWLHQRKKRQTPPVWQRTMPSSRDIPCDYLDADGRRHRRDAPYLLRKDEKEMQRLDYQHFILHHVLHGNFFAPVFHLLQESYNVLDVGCGTGRWGHEIATLYPQTSIIGFDLEDILRTRSTPLNSHFFQYTYQRSLVARVPFNMWPQIILELKRANPPGGWIELVEMGNT